MSYKVAETNEMFFLGPRELWDPSLPLSEEDLELGQDSDHE